MQYTASTINRTALPRSKRMRALGAASVTPAVVNGESGDKYWYGEIDTETEETEVSTTYPVKISKRLRIVDESGASHGDISIDANGRFVFDKGIISKEDIIAYGVGVSDIKSVTDVIEEYLAEHGVGGYEPPVGGIPKSDLSSSVQASLGKADTALQEHQSLQGYATERWVEGKGYLTAHQDISGKSNTTHTHSVKINGVTKTIAASGGTAVDLGTYLTSHQDISGKADKTSTVSTVSYDATNKKITKTINGTTSDVVSVATLKSAMDAVTSTDLDNAISVEVQARINAINALDVTSKGGSGKYIQSISQTDGKISATAATLDKSAVGLGNVDNTADYSKTVYSSGRVRIHNHTTNDIWYPIVWSNSNNGNSDVDTQLLKSNSNFMYNPNRKAVRLSRIESLNSKSSINISDAYLVLGYSCVSNGIDTYLDGKNIHLRCGTDWTEALTIASNANVGIGTTSPLSKLHIYQSAWNNGLVLQRSVNNGGCCIKVLDGLGNQLGVFGVNGSKNFELGLNDANGTEQTRLYVLGSNGNVGIGTDSPSYKLHVEGSVYSNGNLAVEGYSNIKGRIKTSASTSTTAGGGIELGNCKLLQLSNSIMCFADEFRFAAKDAGWSWNQWAGLKYDYSNKKIYLGIADGTVFNKNGNALTGGTVQLVNCGLVASGDVTAYSDRRLKSDIKDLEFRGSLSPKTYIKDGKRCVGFIAQEVRELYPELVLGEETENEYLSLNYGAITAVLAAENKELRSRIDKLETLINKLIEK